MRFCILLKHFQPILRHTYEQRYNECKIQLFYIILFINYKTYLSTVASYPRQ